MDIIDSEDATGIFEKNFFVKLSIKWKFDIKKLSETF